jgi:hypothetical protein
LAQRAAQVPVQGLATTYAPLNVHTQPAVGSPAVPEAPARYVGRARTMEDVSGASVEELSIRNVRWRYTLNFFGDISLSANRPVDGLPFGFGLGAADSARLYDATAVTPASTARAASGRARA